MENTILEFKNITKEFPGVQALKGVSFDVKEGEVLALLGQNGAGKSTLVKCLTGANVPTSGSIKLFGKEYDMITPKQAKENGVGAVYQEQNLAENLPVVENVFMGNLPGNGVIVDYQEMLRRAQEIFDSFGVDIDPKASIASLSPAKGQIVEIAKATAQNLKILILDEPTAPLTTKETETLFSIIRKLKTQGVSFIYISHRLEEIFEICDRAVVMRDGEYEGETLIKDTTREELIKMMIGRDLGNYIPDREDISTDEVVLKVEHLTGNGDRDISFELHKGEILGFAGLVGAGRTELVEMLFNKEPHESGTIEIKGKPFTGKQPWDAIEQGIALLPEDRKRTGLFLNFPVGFNVSLPSLKRFSRFGVIDKKQENECIDGFCKKLQVKTPNYQQLTQYLSGGNQQKLIVAKWLATNSDIIIFDEPTRGIDVGTKHEIYMMIDELAKEGCSIIIVSSENEEIMGLADRIIVMSEGEIAGSLNKDQYNKELLLDLASGKR